MLVSDLAELLRDKIGQCSPAERKVARVLLAGYPVSGLQTAATLAEQAGVSAPTVLRLVNRLGFSGYPDFQKQLRAELGGRTASPATLYQATDFPASGTSGAETVAARTAQCAAAAVTETFATVPASELDTAIGLLADHKRRLWIHGGRFSALFGQYLGLHLTQLRESVSEVPRLPVERTATLAGLGRRDVLVLLDFRRYEPISLRIAQLAREQEATLLLLTDPWLSPISAIADVVLPAKVDSVSPYDSLVPLTALIEALVTGVLARLGPAAHRRMQHLEETAQRWNLYVDRED